MNHKWEDRTSPIIRGQGSWYTTHLAYIYVPVTDIAEALSELATIETTKSVPGIMKVHNVFATSLFQNCRQVNIMLQGVLPVRDNWILDCTGWKLNTLFWREDQ